MKVLLRNILPALLIIIVIAASCSGRKSKAEHKDLIPEDKLIPVLTDMYLADGLLSLPKYNKRYAGNDSISAYREVIEQHGYTQAQVDRTIRYYFVKRPKKFIKLYDKVLGRLSEMESRIRAEAPLRKTDQNNLWEGRTYILLPDPYSKEQKEFNFQVPASGYYNLKFTIVIYPDDPSVLPSPGIFVYSADSLGTGLKYYFPSLPYIKDGQPHTYKANLIIRQPGKRLFVSGSLTGNKCWSPDAGEYKTIENIILSRNPVE